MDNKIENLNIFNAIPLLLMCIIGLPFFLFNKSDRRIAEQNVISLISPKWDAIQNESLSEAERKHLKEKWNIISRGTYLDRGISKEVRNFFKRNNIDIYSEDFDPEYVAKCVKEQEIC